jgi:hypothetical protein
MTKLGTRRWLAAALASALVALGAPAASAAPHPRGPRRPPTVSGSTSFAVDAASVPDVLAAPQGPGVVVPSTSPAPPGSPGEGVLWLALAAPGTSWSSSTDTSVVADVRVDGAPVQQVVLFAGSAPFTYTAFTGPAVTGRHTVTVSVDRALSHTASPSITVERITMGVVLAANPDYLGVAYAPVVYGRHSSATQYTPLLTYVSVTPGAGGSHHLEYVYVISAHDQGDSIVPAYQWGLWGRMTDIVTMLDETVAASGSVTSAVYASCGCESIPDFPDSVEAPEETTAPFAGTWFGHHVELRDATATNYLSDSGTTPFRFQQDPVAAPPPGQLRDETMDAHPWTYQISNDELPREHVISTNPDDLLVGDYRQYAIVDSNISVEGSVAVEFELRLSGNPAWYSTDYMQMTGGVASQFPFNNGGHTRSAIKLPLDWEQRPVVAFRVRLEVRPGGSATATIHSLELLGVTSDFEVERFALPTVQVYSQPSVVATALAPILGG